MMGQAHNKKYIEFLEDLKKALVGKKHVEECDDPKFKTIERFGSNCLFPFSISTYRKIAEEIKRR
jgi:hypothetical protein